MANNLEEIGFPAVTNERAKEVTQFTNLQRCELIVTDACNLRCVYCKGLSKKNYSNINKFDAASIIEEWIKGGLQHASFSGGEPLCNPHMSFYINMLKQRGTPFISISTNGTFPIEKYMELVELGVTHFAISIDGMDAAIVDVLAGVPGTWNKVVKNVKALSKCSYVTASIVFTELNVHQAPEIISFVHSLGVADIRFSSAVQFNKLIPQMEKISKEILECHPILKYRVNNLISGRNMRGNNSNKRCWIPLDDMVVAGNRHYPCSMQLREDGIHIGDTLNKDGSQKSIEQIREERALWCKSFDCSTNKICKTCCMDFIIDYNIEVNKRKDEEK